MVQQVFGGRLADATLDLLTDAVGRRWTFSRDLADVLERLSEIAVVRSAGAKAEPGDRRAVRSSRGSSTATPTCATALSDPARSVDDKAALVDSLLDGKALPATVTLAKQALAGTYRTVTGALATYREVAAETQGEAVATVRVARPMSDADQRRLAETLGSSTTRPCTSTSSSTRTSSAASASRSATRSSTAPSPAGSTTPDGDSPADRPTRVLTQTRRAKRVGKR